MCRFREVPCVPRVAWIIPDHEHRYPSRTTLLPGHGLFSRRDRPGPIFHTTSIRHRKDSSSDLKFPAPCSETISLRGRLDSLTGLCQAVGGGFRFRQLVADLAKYFVPGPRTRSIHDQSDILAVHSGLPVRKTLHDVLEDVDNFNVSGRVTKEPLARTGGTYSDVYRGNLTNHDGKEVAVAIKLLRPNIFSPENLEKCIASEMSIWSKISHPNVLSLIGYSLDFGPYPAFVTEWMREGTLLDHLQNHRVVHKFSMVCGVARGLEYLHKNNIIHSDLKCCNIVVSDCGAPLLMDFGHSRQLDYSRLILTTREMTGTFRWMAFEMFGIGKDGVPPVATFESDIWSFGMTVLEMISGQVPYLQYKHDAQIMFAIVNGELPGMPNLQTPCDQHLWTLCKMCWARPVTRRPSMSILLGLLRSMSCSCTL
ncbi:kinase-like protein [Rickenella mellea]|uniref:Kinase-like protein n=1 Tax=Rickenella mellea TaxID=50990 RepID=A0A4Y7PH16_9AGAM|nr:kinase-like protein [Rickenella mellea]